MDIPAYLQRIAYRGSLAPTGETLRELQLAHLLAVPFENLSIHANEPIILDDDALFDKIVNRRRGGFCYELNGLFRALLNALGFNVAMLSAGVVNADGIVSPDFDHMTLMVTLEDRWLADVGFGDSFREPLLLDERQEQIQGNRAYKITPDGSHLILSQCVAADEWKSQYRFTLEPYSYPDYAEMCHYHQTSPQSHFTKAPLCTMATPDGRLTLSDMRLITTLNGGERQERALKSEEEYATVLRERFGIVITN